MSNKEQSDNKSPYSEEELEYFKDLLLDKRHEAKQEHDRIKDSIDDIKSAEDEDRSSATHHQGDLGTDTEDLETLYTLLDRERTFIEQIDAALERIEKGTYGRCLATGKKIPKERLEAVPHTRYSIEAKNKGLVEED